MPFLFFVFFTLKLINFTLSFDGLDAKDDNGFAPLKIRQAESKHWEITGHTYHHHLKKLFELKLDGQSLCKGVHSPNWVTCVNPVIEITPHTLVLKLLKDSLEPLITLGKIDFQRTHMTKIEAIDFMKNFLNIFTAHEGIIFSFKNSEEPLESDFCDNWTEIDESIFQHLEQAFFLKNTLNHNNDEINEGVVVAIGEFFKMRDYIYQFINQINQRSLKNFEINMINFHFENYLKNILNVPNDHLRFYTSFLNPKTYSLSLLMKKTSLDNPDFIEKVLKRFQKNGYIENDNSFKKYKDFFGL